MEQDSISTNYNTWAKDESVFRNLHKDEIIKVIRDFYMKMKEYL